MSLFPPPARGRDQCHLRTAGLAAAQRYLFRLGPEQSVWRSAGLLPLRSVFGSGRKPLGRQCSIRANPPYLAQGDWTVAAEYEGNPNGLKIRNDGLSISPTTRTVS